MKKFIIGVLVGALVAGAVCLLMTSNNNSHNTSSHHSREDDEMDRNDYWEEKAKWSPGILD